jgi:ribose transport system ATP-binding protein
MNETDVVEYALEMTGIGKRFGPNWVLKDVSLKVRKGSIHAILGHNGAGKSTLMKIALGALRPTEGGVLIGGKRLTFSRPAEARTLGLGMVAQERSLIPTLTGIDNLFLNSERLNGIGFVNVRRQHQEVVDLMRQLRVSPLLLSMSVSDMSTIEQELIEIAKALRLGDRVLILDEPTAPLGREEIERLFEVLRVIAARGTGIVLITHHLPEVFAVSDQVTCLREGAVVLSCPTKETHMSELVAAMLGRRPWNTTPAHGRPTHVDPAPGFSSKQADRRPALIVRNLRVGEKLAEVSFDVFPGEIVGLVGLGGSGRTTLLRTLFGDLRATNGQILLHGEPYRPLSPQYAISRGMFLIPEDRSVHGLILSKSIAENVILVVLRRLMNRFRFLRFAEGRDHAQGMMEALEIRASSVDQTVSELSGGNQQKVVLAKALTLSAAVLLLDEPTFGVDIGASREIMSRVRSLAENGAAVLWASSDLLEITHVADRVMVIRDGVVGGTLTREDPDEFNEDRLLAMMQRRQFQDVVGGHEAGDGPG